MKWTFWERILQHDFVYKYSALSFVFHNKKIYKTICLFRRNTTNHMVDIPDIQYYMVSVNLDLFNGYKLSDDASYTTTPITI